MTLLRFKYSNAVNFPPISYPTFFIRINDTL